MTNGIAKENLKEWFDNDGIGEIDAVDFILALNALDKQIPKKPTPHIVQPVEAPIKIGNGRWQKGTTVYKCPNCKEWVSKIYKHCPDCGQALDWSDNE